MVSLYIFALALAALAHAQDSNSNQTANLLLPADNASNLGASVISANPSAVAYKVACVSGGSAPATKRKRQNGSSATAQTNAAQPTGSDYDDSLSEEALAKCPFPTPLTITQGASTLHFAYYLGQASQIVDCTLSGTTEAVCVGTATGSGVETPGVSTATLTGTDLPSPISVSVTAGASKLSSTSSSSSTLSSASATKGSGASSTGSPTSGAPPAATSKAAAYSCPWIWKILALVASASALLLL